jgi:hypothetical protein
MSNSVQQAFPTFFDANGLALEAGYIYVGREGFDAQSNPVAVYWDRDLTIHAEQPVRTLAGYPSRDGSPAMIYTEGGFSLTVRNKFLELVYSALRPTLAVSTPQIEFADRSALSAALSDGLTPIDGLLYVADGLQYVGSPGATVIADLPGLVPFGIPIFEHFGAKGDGVTDDSVAMQACVNYVESIGGGVIFARAVTYISNNVTVPSKVYVVGSGINATTFKASANNAVMRLGTLGIPSNGGGISHADIRGYWNQVEGERTSSFGVVVTQSNKGALSHLRVLSCHVGIVFIQCSKATCDEVTVLGAGTDQNRIGFLQPEQTVLLNRNAVIFTRCTALRCSLYGFRIITGSGSQYSDCEVAGSPANDTTQIGFYVGDPVGATPATVEFMHFANCLADQCSSHNILFSKGTATLMRDIQWQGLWSGGSNNTGLRVVDGIGMQFSGIICRDAVSWGVNFLRCTDCTITGGVIKEWNKGNPATGGAAGILLQDCFRCVVTGNAVRSTYTTAPDVVSIREEGTSNQNVIVGNGAVNGGKITGADSLWNNNEGIKTTESGTAEVAGGSTSIVVSHGANFTPTFGQVQLTPRDNPGANYWVSAITATTFTISMASAPGGAIRFGWNVSRSQ